jgi:hypothetical protein
MRIDDAYRILGIQPGAAQADAVAAHRALVSAASEDDAVHLNLAYEAVSQDIWRRAQPAVDAVEPADAERLPEPWEDVVGQRPPSRWKVGLLVLGLVVVALATAFVVGPRLSSGEDPEWSDEFKANIVQGCTVASRGQDDVCRCLVDEMSMRMTEDEYLRLNYEALTTGSMPEEIIPLATRCGGQPT